MPKLKVITWRCGYKHEEIRNFEDGKHILNFGTDNLVTVEGKVLSCFDELTRLAEKVPYCNKPILEVIIMPLLAGG